MAKIVKMENKAKLYNRRITKFCDTNFDENQDEISLNEALHNLEILQRDYNENLDEFIIAMKDQNIDAILQDSQEFDEKYDRIIIIIKRKLKALGAPIEKASNNISGPDYQPNKINKINLPDIPLPIFNGTYEEWINFKEKFTALITENVNLNNVEKLHYLKATLIQDAALIQSPNDTFASLWSALAKRYEIKRIIIEKHINEIFQHKSVNKESSEELRNLVNCVIKNLRILNSLNLKLDKMSEMFLISIICNKIDNETRKLYEMRLSTDDIPKWEDMLTFLQNRCYTLENIEKSKSTSLRQNYDYSSKKHNFSNHEKQKYSKTNSFSINEKSDRCKLCNFKNHYINQCFKFLNLSVQDRKEKVKNLGICMNCFSDKHIVSKCTSRNCKRCSLRHHTLLHDENATTNNINSHENRNNPESTNLNHDRELPTTSMIATGQQILLSTVVIIIYDSQGNGHHCRALLDSGSQSNFATEHVAQMIKANRVPVNMSVCGLNQKSSCVKSKFNATIKSRISTFERNIQLLVLPQLSGNLPSININTDHWKLPIGIQLADPQFNIPQPIDLILGADIFFDSISQNQLRINDKLPVLQETLFGWVVAGKININYTHMSTNAYHSLQCDEQNSNLELTHQIKKFWEIENCASSNVMSIEEKQAEKHFEETHLRQVDGRYVVTLPTKLTIQQLGSNKNIALKRFSFLEQKLMKNPGLHSQYSKFMDEYLQLDHMYESPSEKIDEQLINYFLPHHAVIKPENTSTKLRVVFDASAKSDTGLSLNDVLKTGPTVQQELFEIIIRFRKHRFAFTADINKMYRQVLVNPSQHQLQKIMWRKNIDEDIKTYSLRTVTYGTACAPFLATKTLNQLANDEEETFPMAARITRNDFYVDDILSGSNTIDEAIELQKSLVQLLAKGGFKLHKWATNTPELLENISKDDQQDQKIFSNEQSVKTLGLIWQPVSDKLLISSNINLSNETITKRSILSDIAKIFDPIGIAGPIILTAKSILQSLWQKNVSWDDPVDEEDCRKWSEFRNQLHAIQKIEVPRCVINFNNYKSIQLIGFCDASIIGYGACVYIRSIDLNYNYSSSLLCSKSRVAPLKVLTIPRLELCSAVLLAELVSKVKKSMQIEFEKTILWTDSTIVLGWIRSSSNKMKTFVSHRVAEIQDITNISDWRHIKTDDNPADIISRGLMPSQLKNCDIWWNGPQFLTTTEETWPLSKNQVETELPEMKLSTSLIANTSADWEVINKFSLLSKLQRVIAYVLRFVKNCRKNQIKRETQHLTVQELVSSLKVIVKIVQKEAFHDEINCIQQNKGIPLKSVLLSLNIFLDEDNLLRVGGRIKNSSEAYETKHQLVLPKHHHFTKILIRDLHTKNGHVGQQALLSIVRQNYWPVGAKDIIRNITRNCIVCFKHNPKLVNQFMGDLPTDRVTLVHPFLNTGVDYAGPVLLRVNRKTSVKAYIAIFVCMATKAIHIELVSDLSSKAYIAALSRFIARRGLCKTIYSDNGTNFQGAKNELLPLYHMLEKKSNLEDISNNCAMHQIEFHFIPPRAPHMGGLWEAAVKVAKYHLRRIIGNTNLSFEELSTIVTKIEAILNSRPLFPESHDPEDFTAITPGHFLIGRPLLTMVEPDYTETNINRLKRWQLLQKITQHFWQRWSKDYLTTLQQRQKSSRITNLQEGMLVIIKEDELPTMHWPLGRIVQLHPGQDNVTRVVSVKLHNRIIKRPAVKLCVLPIQQKS